MLQRVSLAAYLLGGGSTLLVMFGLSHWASVTVSAQNMLTTFISLFGFEPSMIRANQSCNSLQSIKDWWDTLSESEQMNLANKEQLVKDTEDGLSIRQSRL